MKAIAQNEIIALVSDINAFADKAEHLINTTQATYDRDKITLQSRHKSAVTSLDTNYRNSCASVNIFISKSSQNFIGYLFTIRKVNHLHGFVINGVAEQ